MLIIQVDKQTTIPYDSILAFSFTTSMSTIFPRGTLYLKDSTLIHSLEILVGSIINVVNIDKDLEIEEDLVEFVVESINTQCTDVTTFTGGVEIMLVHPLELYKNVSSHAFPKKTANQIIQQIFDENKVAKDYIKEFKLESCDEFNHPWYCCGMTTTDFIFDILLPYTSIEGQPPLFYYTNKKRLFLTTMKKVWQQMPRITLGTDTALATGKTNLETHARNLAALSNTGDKGATISSIGFNIGGPEHLRNLRVSSLVTDEYASGALRGDLEFNPDTAVQSPTQLPISRFGYGMFDESTSTDKFVFRNHASYDSGQFALNTSVLALTLLKCKVTLDGYFRDLETGGTVHLISGYDDKNKDWREGKWVIYSLSILTGPGKNGACSMELTLCRPTLDKLEDYEAVKGMYYEV